jgi:signal peptidase
VMTEFVAPEAPQTERDVKKKSEKEPGFLHYVGVALSVALLFAVLTLGAILIVIPKLAGAVPLTVLTNSMEPGLPPGTLVIIKPVEIDDIKIGDVITYQIKSGEPGVITHRVIGITPLGDERQFTLQGDNNGAADEGLVKPVQIQGRLWYSVPYVGFVNSAVNGENKSWIVYVIAGLLLAYAAWMVISGIFGRKKKPTGRRVAGR